MNIVADENIPFAENAFSTLGEVRVLPGRGITPERLRDATVVVVRSVTKVNADLLGSTPVRFVATATIGTDHVDAAYLASRDIGFASAPGSNANSVAEYIVAALLNLSLRRGDALSGKAIGVVGCGNVGSRVAAKAEALGMRVLHNDPPLLRATGDPKYVPLEDLFDADFISLHVPLTHRGPDATSHMADDAFFRSLRPGAAFLNSSRGAVLDSAALGRALDCGIVGDAVLDVWENEPHIDFGLVGKACLATPHIAGYSFDGKLNGTRMVYEAACRFLGRSPSWRLPPEAVPSAIPALTVDATSRPDEAVLDEAVRALYDIKADDASLRAVGSLGRAQRGPRFEELRKTYPQRREFSHTTVTCLGGTPALKAKLQGIGFRLA